MRPYTILSRPAIRRSATFVTLLSVQLGHLTVVEAQEVSPDAAPRTEPREPSGDATEAPQATPEEPAQEGSAESPEEPPEEVPAEAEGPGEQPPSDSADPVDAAAAEGTADEAAPTGEAESSDEAALAEDDPAFDDAAASDAAASDAAASDGAEGEFPDQEFPDEGFFEEEGEMEFGAVAEVEAPPREPTKRTLDKEQLTRIPGTRGDALRAIEIMPGVARTAFGANDGPPLLRGGSSEESLVLLDGAPVPLLYHFGGLTSFFNSQLLESVDLYPGNYSARYGRAAGGVVEARVRDPRDDKFHAMLELSAIDSFALVESPVGKKTSIALAARRSNIDLFFDAFVPDDAFSVQTAPVYYDYQAILSHRFDENHQLRILGFGSHDRLKFYFDDAVQDDPALRGSIDGRTQFHRGQVEINSKFSELLTQRIMVSVGPSIQHTVLGDLKGKFTFMDVNARGEWSIFAHERLRIDTGFDFQMFAGTGDYHGPAPVADEGSPNNDPLAGEEFITIEQDTVYPIRPAAYVEASWRPIDEWLIIPGVRADYIADAQDWTVDPRLSSRLTVHEGTTLKGGVGMYSQPNEYFQTMEDLGNPDLKPYRTLQTSFGVEQTIVQGVKADVEGFYKYWYDRPVGTEGGAPPRFLNDGNGRAYGMEVLLDVRPTERTQAFVSYTLARSERRDGKSEDWRLFDYDQTHNLSLTANYDLGKGWLVGARFRYVTGNPTTYPIGSVYDANSDTYRGLYGAANADRLPAFHQLDVRGEKRWDIGPVGLTLYLEIMNVYNRQNVEGISYSYDFSQTERAVGMPIFPNLGIRGEL